MREFLDRVEFDLKRGEILDGDTRYVMLRADVLRTILFASTLPGPASSHPAANAVTEFGGRSLRRYHNETGPSRAALREVVTHTAAALGWGIWRFAVAGDTEVLEVKNSPFAQAGEADHPACYPIVGLFRALCDLDGNNNASVTETHCVSMGASACRFESTPASV